MKLGKNPRKLLGLTFVAFVAIFLLSSYALSQSHLATIEGTVMDEDGVPLPGATITVRNVDTGYTKSAVSQSDGGYILSAIQPGKYECEVTLSGFATQLRRGMTFSVGARLTIDFTLAAATLEEEVTVTAESPMVEVTKSEISSVIGREAIDNMPLYDRDFVALSVIRPGVQMSEGGEIRGNAQPRGYGEMIVDGVSNENTAGGSARTGIPADAIQEFRVMTNQFEAEFGNASGLLRSAITRSGSNEFRGRLSYFYRDETLDNVNYFVNHDGYQGSKLPDDEWENPPYSHHNFAGFLGGPIAKDRAHFFLSYEGLRRKEYATITAPIWPQETVEVPLDRNQLLAKIDYQPSEKHLLSAKYTMDRLHAENYAVGGMIGLEQAYHPTIQMHDFQANWTFYPSENSVNELRLQYAYEHDDIAVSPGLEDSYFVVRPGGYEGAFGNLPQWNKFSRYQAVDNLSLFLEDHSLKFGFDISYCPWHAHIPQYMPGMFVFQTDEPFNPADPETYPFLFQYDVGRYDLLFPYTEVGVFAQDSWRVSSRLTLNYGLRYNYYYSEGSTLASWNIRNLNPRFGFSWDPVGDGRTSIRGGIGTYSTNPLANPSGYTSFMSGVEEYLIFFPGYPDPFQPNPFAPSIPFQAQRTIFDQIDGQIPSYTMQATLGFQREVVTSLSVGADLVYARGHRLMYQHQMNPVIPGTYFVRPDPTVGEWYRIVDWGKSDYKALYFTLNKRYSNGWSLDISYTLSRSYSDTENEFSRQDSYADLEKKFMWGPTNLDARHILSIAGIVDLPLNIQLSGIMYYRSKLPWNAIYSYDKNADSLISDYIDEYRNSRRGFDLFFLNIRLSWFANFSRLRLQIFAEVYNLTNKVNFMSVYSQYNDINPAATPNFGEPLEAGSPRQLQIGVRLDF